MTYKLTIGLDELREELDFLRDEITLQHKVRRETSLRSVAYRAGCRIIELKERRKIVRRALREGETK